MTPEEKNARRRELDRNPFHLALTHKTQKAWRDAHKVERNAKRRANYAAHVDEMRAKAKAWRDRNKDKVKASWKRYMAKPGNKAKVYAKLKERAKDPAIAKRKRELRRIREKDPKRANHRRWVKRLYYHTHKHDVIGIRAYVRQDLRERWQSVVAAGEEETGKYLKRCGVRVRSFFAKWRRAGMPTEIDDIMVALGYGEERR